MVFALAGDSTTTMFMNFLANLARTRSGRSPFECAGLAGTWVRRLVLSNALRRRQWRHPKKDNQYNGMCKAPLLQLTRAYVTIIFFLYMLDDQARLETSPTPPLRSGRPARR